MLLLTAVHVAAAGRRHKPVACPNGRFLVGGDALVGRDGLPLAVDVGPDGIDMGCAKVRGDIRSRRAEDVVQARWAQCGDLGRVVLRAGIAKPSCAVLQGTVRIAGGRPSRVVAIRSACGDSLVDVGAGEECDASAPGGDDVCPGGCAPPGAPAACRCASQTSTTTSPPSSTTRLPTAPPISTSSPTSSVLAPTTTSFVPPHIEPASTTTSTTLPLLHCGDGIIQDPEECDDPSLGPKDGCTPACMLDRSALRWHRVSRPFAADDRIGREGPSLSGDGRFVAFRSASAALAPGDDNGRTDVFVADVSAATVERIVVGGRSNSTVQPVMTGSGREVVFAAQAPDFAPELAQGLFVYDRDSHEVFQVPIDPGITLETGTVPSVVADGRFIAFVASVPAGSRSIHDTFVYDRATNTTTRVGPVEQSGGGGVPGPPNLSDDGATLVFAAPYGSLAGQLNVFLYDFATRSTSLVSHRLGSAAAGNGHSWQARITADGRIVLFTSFATDLVNDADPRNDTLDGFVFFRPTDHIARVPRPSLERAFQGGRIVDANADGRLLLYFWEAGITLAEFTNGTFAFDARTGKRHPILRDEIATSARLSGNGCYLALVTDDALEPDDVNGVQDVYIRRVLQPVVTDVCTNRLRPGTSTSVTVQTRAICGAASLDFGPGVSVGNVTVVSPDEITADVSVAADAVAGPRDVAVRDGGIFSGDDQLAECAGCLVVDPGADPTTVCSVVTTSTAAPTTSLQTTSSTTTTSSSSSSSIESSTSAPTSSSSTSSTATAATSTSVTTTTDTTTSTVVCLTLEWPLGGATGVDGPSASSGPAFDADATTGADGAPLVVWVGHSSLIAEGDAIYGRRLDASGKVVGNPVRLSVSALPYEAAPQWLAAVGLSNGDFLVAWWWTRQSVVRGRLLGADGQPIGPELILADGTEPDLAAGGSGAVVVVRRGDAVVAQRLAADGTPAGAELEVTGGAGERAPSVAVDPDGNVMVTTILPGAIGVIVDAPGGAFYVADLLARRFDVQGNPLGSVTALERESMPTTLLAADVAAAPGGEWTLVWNAVEVGVGAQTRGTYLSPLGRPVAGAVTVDAQATARPRVVVRSDGIATAVTERVVAQFDRHGNVRTAPVREAGAGLPVIVAARPPSAVWASSGHVWLKALTEACAPPTTTTTSSLPPATTTSTSRPLPTTTTSTSSSTTTTQPGGPMCVDGTRNGSETDVDCGGADCRGCADGLRCDTDADCESGTCSAHTCTPAPCALVGGCRTGTVYFDTDAVGSPIVATDERGTVLWRQAYAPFGERRSGIARPADQELWFTARPQEPATGLLTMGRRPYQAYIGRFYAMDPVDFRENDPQSFNRFAYANGNPYRFVDPSGGEPRDNAVRDGFEGALTAGHLAGTTVEGMQAVMDVRHALAKSPKGMARLIDALGGPTSRGPEQIAKAVATNARELAQLKQLELAGKAFGQLGFVESAADWALATSRRDSLGQVQAMADLAAQMAGELGPAGEVFSAGYAFGSLLDERFELSTKLVGACTERCFAPLR